MKISDNYKYLSSKVLYFVIWFLLTFTSFGNIYFFREYSLNYRNEYLYKKSCKKKGGLNYTQYLAYKNFIELIYKLKSKYKFIIQKLTKIENVLFALHQISFSSIKHKFHYFIDKPHFSDYYFSF